MNASWPARPVIYEINTWVWLNELSRQNKRTITLGTVPSEQWDAIASLAVDAVWLMGVWERSPEGIRIANENAGLQADFRNALPDYTPADNIGSGYCVHRYVVDERLGGPEGLVTARQMLAQRGLRLILDFVPNHVAPDHPWVFEHPEYFVQGTREDLERAPGEFFEAGGTVIANGRDPYFPPWPEEYWREVISAVQLQHPNVLFMAEAYWDLEWDLQQLGFDYCYDKRLCDRLEHDNAESVRLHLTAGLDYQDKLVRFIENPDEPIDSDLQAFYHKLLAAVKESGLREGEWQLCDRTGWPDNSSYLNLVAWCWRPGESHYLVVVNISEYQSQACIHLPWDNLAGRTWQLTDVLNDNVFKRNGDEMHSTGLYVDLPAWRFHYLCFQPD